MMGGVGEAVSVQLSAFSDQRSTFNEQWGASVVISGCQCSVTPRQLVVRHVAKRPQIGQSSAAVQHPHADWCEVTIRPIFGSD